MLNRCIGHGWLVYVTISNEQAKFTYVGPTYFAHRTLVAKDTNGIELS